MSRKQYEMAWALSGSIALLIPLNVTLPVHAAQTYEEIVFECESSNTVLVRYGAADFGENIQISYRDRTFELYPVRSAGDHFATEDGLDVEMGLQWRMDGNNWHLSEMSMDHTASGAVIIETCIASAGDTDNDLGSPIPDEIVGTWELTMLPRVTLSDEDRPTATFDTDGNLNGSTGCNRFGSRVVQTPTGISISNSFMTRMGCEDRRHVVERAFLDALEGATAFEIDGRSLTLLDENEDVLADFEAVSAKSAD